MEIFDLTDPQKSRFEEAYEVCKVVMEKTKIFPVTPADQQQALDIDELDAGWPKMTIDMMLDIVTAAICICNKDDAFKGTARVFKGSEEIVFSTVKAREIEKNKFSWLAIAKRLWRLKKADVFATREADRIQVDEMLAAGKISIIDLSDMDAPYIRNIVIAQILRRLQSCQDTRYKEREAADGARRMRCRSSR